MDGNPFSEQTGAICAYINAMLAPIARSLERLEAQINAPPPRYESLVKAMKTRHVSRKTLVDAMNDGRLDHKEKPGRGGINRLLCVRCLDQHFPAVNHNKKPQG